MYDSNPNLVVLVPNALEHSKQFFGNILPSDKHIKTEMYPLVVNTIT